MSDATKWSDFEKMIQEMVRSALNELGELVNDMVKKQIDEDVYVNTPEVYNRTYEFRESFESVDVTKDVNNPEIFVRSNKNKMESRPEVFQHGSYYWRKGSDVTDYLPEILAFNLSGDFFGGGWWRNRDSYFYNVLDKLKAGGWLNKTFKQLLRKRGLKVV